MRGDMTRAEQPQPALGKAVRALRERRGVTQEALALGTAFVGPEAQAHSPGAGRRREFLASLPRGERETGFAAGRLRLAIDELADAKV